MGTSGAGDVGVSVPVMVVGALGVSPRGGATVSNARVGVTGGKEGRSPGECSTKTPVLRRVWRGRRVEGSLVETGVVDLHVGRGP